MSMINKKTINCLFIIHYNLCSKLRGLVTTNKVLKYFYLDFKALQYIFHKIIQE